MSRSQPMIFSFSCLESLLSIKFNPHIVPERKNIIDYQDRLQLWYDTTDPETYRLIKYKPVIDTSTTIQRTDGIINSTSDRNTVRFEYRVNEEQYEKWQYCPPNINLKEGDKIEIEYHPMNPMISRIVFN